MKAIIVRYNPCCLGKSWWINFLLSSHIWSWPGNIPVWESSLLTIKTYSGNLQKHIRLYDKGAGLLFPEDVKRYFSNYIAAGSVTCRTLRETLLKELENTVDKGVNRFESVVDGQRTYLGHLIPADAPPRPDASAVWDDVKKRWAH